VAEMMVVGILVTWNLTSNLADSGLVSAVAALSAVVLLLAVARGAGVSWAQLGLDKTWVGRGIRIGAAAAAIVAGSIIALAVLPFSREFLADDRFAGESTSAMLVQVLIRIPVATALAEELAFRGVALGLLLRWMSPLRAVLASSALFGLWHILPAIDALDTNPAADLASGTLATIGEVGIQVLVTGIAGGAFAWLRFRATSIVAPVLAHWSLNGAAYLVGWLVVRHGWG